MPARLACAEPLDLVADPRGFLIILELHRDLELLLQSLDRTDRSLALEVLPPLEQELEFGAFPLVVLLAVIGEEAADGPDAGVDQVERHVEIFPAQGLGRPGAGMHHLDVGTVAVELDAIALADGVFDDEGEEAEVARRVPG